MTNVAVLGASDNPERYSYKAIKLLEEYGHKVFPVHPTLKDVEGLACFKSVTELSERKIPIDTVTVYVGPQHQAALIPSLVALRPRRVILNPGSEGEELKQALRQAAIDYEEACTLVLLRTGQF